MKNLSEYINNDLEIVNTSFFKANYDLRAGGLTLHSLRSIGAWGNNYEVAGPDKTWEIVRPSIWSNNLEIKEKGSGVVIAEIKGSAFKSSSVINLPRGEKLNIVLSIWKSTFEIQNELGTALVSFKNKKWYSSDVIVSIKSKTETLDKYPFIILLAYLMVLQKRHNAAAAA